MRGRRAGFTLIELLTTLALVGVVAGALAASLSATVRVRQATADRLDRLEDVQRLARLVRADLEHLVAVPHALRIAPSELVLLRTPPRADSPSRDASLVIVRYRRAEEPGTEPTLVREAWSLRTADWNRWSEASLGPSPSSAVPTFEVPDEGLAVFRGPETVEWTALEFSDGAWHATDGEAGTTVRALQLQIAADASSASVPGRRRVGEPWVIRIPLDLPLVEETQS